MHTTLGKSAIKKTMIKEHMQSPHCYGGDASYQQRRANKSSSQRQLQSNYCDEYSVSLKTVTSLYQIN